MKKLLLSATLAASMLVPLSAAAWPGRPDRPTADNPPPTEPGWRTDDDGHYRRFDRFDRPDRFRDHWVALSSFTPAANGRTTVHLTGRDRRVDRLRLESVRGTPRFEQLVVEYTNGDHQRVPLDIELAPGEDHVVAIAGDRRVQRVTVLTRPGSRGSFSLYAD